MRGRRTCLWKFLRTGDAREAQRSLRSVEDHFEHWHKVQADYRYITRGSSELGKELLVRVVVAHYHRRDNWHFRLVQSQIPHIHATVLIDDQQARREAQWPDQRLSEYLVNERACDSIIPHPGKEELGRTAFIYIRYKAATTPHVLSLYESPGRTNPNIVSLLDKIQSEFEAHGCGESRLKLGQTSIRRFVADCEADLLKWWGKDTLDRELNSLSG